LTSVLIRNGTILTMNDALDVLSGDVWITGDRITAVGQVPADATAQTTIDATGSLVLPGFVQTHVHLCQTLFRGLADDLALLDWLARRIWPLEAAHDDQSLAAAARLAAAELQLGGTTTALTMETVHGTDAVLDALAATGLRAIVGKCLMDVRGPAPARLHQSTAAAIDEALALQRRWDGAAQGRLHTAYAPRFALSCSPDLLAETAALSARDGHLIHSHAAEQRAEVARVRELTGRDNVEYLARLGVASPRLCLAHCVWVSDREQALLAEHQVRVLHCPSSNLRLGSGIAPVVDLRARGVAVSLGADGAACNNTLDMFQEMRLAASLQALTRGPGALTARDAVVMATRDGARALGLGTATGSLEAGKKADVIVVGTTGMHQAPSHDPYATLVFSSRPEDVRATLVDGVVVARGGQVTWSDRQELLARATLAATSLRARAGI
jgi:5-methylthioadenosine/S-adenosylhomocysteine deaminase